MRNIFQPTVMFFALLLPFACGKAPADKTSQLNELKAQKATLETQIATLEKELAAENPSAATTKLKLVGVTEVKIAPFRHYIDLQGKIDADESVAVTSRVPGSLTRVLVKNGDNVRKGQLLATIDDALLTKSLDELNGNLKVAEDIYNRQKGLWDQKIGTEVQYIQAKNAKESLERSITTLKEQMGMYKIYAPTNGTVDMVILKQGQAISPGLPLCNVANLNDLKIVGEVPEVYAAKVRKGDLVTVVFPDLNKEINSRVNYVSKTINPTSRTFTIECALPNGTDYRANMVAIMKIIDYQNPSTVVVPVNVIQTAEDGDFVLIAEKTAEKQALVKKVTVKQGSNYNGQVEILSGLKKGDLLISTGYQDANNGETVAY
ncbi:MAG: efflux RND transporter periplasmic adaptor subunit [Saprospiraceae bacterium]|nr:efflux RND transporter periplasmic adaptor subunit [Saprospiraceae bacterium]